MYTEVYHPGRLYWVYTTREAILAYTPPRYTHPTTPSRVHPPPSRPTLLHAEAGNGDPVAQRGGPGL